MPDSRNKKHPHKQEGALITSAVSNPTRHLLQQAELLYQHFIIKRTAQVIYSA